MFDIGGGELLLVLVIALVVLGPERLPEVVRTVGRWTGRAKAMFNNLRYELEREAYNKELQEKFDAQMRAMGIDPEVLKQPGQTPPDLMQRGKMDLPTATSTTTPPAASVTTPPATSTTLSSTHDQPPEPPHDSTR